MPLASDADVSSSSRNQMLFIGFALPARGDHEALFHRARRLNVLRFLTLRIADRGAEARDAA